MDYDFMALFVIFDAHMSPFTFIYKSSVHILINISFCVLQKKEGHKGFEG